MSQNGHTPVISMVASTLGRSAEMVILLDSLCAQDDNDFELIVVDQNPDDRLVPVLAPYLDKLDIKHIRTNLRGLDRGRNLGAAQASGSWIMFPDDDSWYPPEFLKTLRGLMAREPADIYSGRSLNSDGAEIMVRFLQNDATISRENIWKVLIEWVIVFRMETFRDAGGFDDNLGVGSGTIWNSGEGQDLVLRCLANGAHGLFRRSLYGYHPEHRESQTTPEMIRKMHGYSVGFGYVMRRHGFSPLAMLPSILRPLAGIVIYTLTGKPAMARRSKIILQGRIEGWRSWTGNAANAVAKPLETR
jgi:glycosyltransferase involved in cell wall biosynthesis